MAKEYDVVIIGAGLAGLSLARHLLLETDSTILLVDRRKEPQKGHQKVGESLVQVGGYYLTKVLDLEEYVCQSHYLKFNLRFYWPTPGLPAEDFRDYSKSYSRKISDIANFQLDRNLFEEHLLTCNKADPRLTYMDDIGVPDVELSTTGGDHVVRFGEIEAHCRWVIDTTGQGAWLKRRMDLAVESPIQHGATWCWVDGLVDIEKLTERSWTEVRHDPQRRQAGHFPAFLATNHFCAEGCWFWVIPLHGKTSLGLVYDHAVINPSDVPDAETMIEHVCRTWPLFARDLPQRKVLDEGRYVTYAYGAKQTISPDRWALSGMSGRFSDPLYSPGSDLIAFYNTLIVDAIQSAPEDLPEKSERAERVMQAVYEAYVPSFAVSYDCLGDQECFTLKYGWELAIYFGFYVFPFVNGLMTNSEFVPGFLRKFGLLGPVNKNLHQLLSDYFQWKKTQVAPQSEPKLTDFLDIPSLANSEKMFYEMGWSAPETLDVLEAQYQRMREFARFIAVHVCASVVGDPEAVMNAALVKELKLKSLRFDPKAFQALYESTKGSRGMYEWSFDARKLEALLSSAPMTAAVAVGD